MSIYEIDELRLDKEWTKQSKIFFEQATILADAKREAEEAKRNIEVTEAEIGLDIRNNPDKYGLSKTTEASIASTILLQAEHKEKTMNLITAKHKVDIANASVTALDHKKKALESLVYLQGQNYYSEPQAEGANEHFEEQKKTSLRKKLARRTKDE